MSDARRLRLEVVLQAVDKATRPLQRLLNTNKDLALTVKATRDQLKALERAKGLTGQFDGLRGSIRETVGEMRKARERVERLEQALKNAKAPSAQLAENFKRASATAERLTNKFRAQQTQLAEVRQKLQQAGRGSMTMAQYQEQLQRATTAATQALAKQDAQLKTHNARARAMAASQQAADRMRTHAGNLAAAGAGASVAGAATAAPIWKGLGESKHYELEKTRIGALGLGDTATKESIEFAKQMKAYGVSQVDKAELMRDALSTFADAHHAEMVLPTLAKMKFANKAVFGQAQGADNERMFMDLLKVIELRGGLASEEEFRNQADMVQRVITATGGRVQADEWLNVIKRGGLAAKGMESEAFYYTLEPLVQEMGGNTVGTAMMSAYQNLYQGKTTKRTLGNLDRFGLIADRSKVKEDKAGQVSFMDPGALKGADIFRKDQFAWLEQVLLPTLKEKGITEKDQVLDAIGSIFSNRTASNLMSQMYLQRDQIHKNMRLNKGAAGIDQLDTAAKGLPQGKELEMLAKVHDLEKEIGEKVMPLYARALEWVANAADRVTKFMQENPGVAKAMAVGVGVLAATLLTIGPILLTIASVMWPLAKLRTIFAALTGGARLGAGAMRLLAGGFNLLMRCVGGVGKVLMWIGRALLMNPIGLAVTAIAVAAFLIYKYWEPIKGFFSGLWGQVKEAFNGGIGGVAKLIMNWSPLGLFYSAFAAVMNWFGFEMPTKFTEFGANIIQGLADGIKGAIGWVVDAVSGVADRTIGLFKEKLGIHSPSRVFALLGGFTMAGLSQGLEDGQNGPLQAVHSLATKLTGIGAGIAIGSTAAVAAPISFDTRPALTTSAVAAAPAAAAAPITIHIHPPAGADPQAIARLVRDELRQIENQRAARQRSRLADRD
ncbi:phage tail protein [Ralstonia sp. CHL-2022]|uniref:Phage tail protein n=1 Tax=Ralstonia mojiangensis TaxID=2953895 RepID=A0AAE3I2X0_9RALS|nr:phage tail protein [Ralstonia mojiangensis]MCT7316755.1 phage tail protein [Ralstonia mojiangensis]